MTRPCISRLRAAVPVVLPSLLLCDFGNLEREVRRLEEAGVAALHLDVMDGNFVPNLTYGMPVVESLRRLTKLPLDVHLMIARPDRFAAAFRDAGSDILTFHIEAVPDAGPLLDQIRSLGMGAGLALNPATPLEAIRPYLRQCDLVLVMSVPAGFGGQGFQPVAVDKLRELRGAVTSDVLLEVDGGINQSTIGTCAKAGANLFVVGSAIFRSADYSAAIRALTQRASEN